MLCRIVDLIVQLPKEDGLQERCADYLYTGSQVPDMVIDPGQYRREPYPGGICGPSLAYMESRRPDPAYQQKGRSSILNILKTGCDCIPFSQSAKKAANRPKADYYENDGASLQANAHNGVAMRFLS